MISIQPFIILWLVLPLFFRFIVKLSAWRAIGYGTGISIAAFLVAVVAANWYASGR
jgi:hypothetical protein